jgi:hypothetical protein
VPLLAGKQSTGSMTLVLRETAEQARVQAGNLASPAGSFVAGGRLFSNPRSESFTRSG